MHIVADNAWRRQSQFSTPLLAVGCGRDCCQLFSIPAKNVASCRQSSQVYLAYSNDGRAQQTRHFAKFRSGFISHSGLKITWEISHQFEMRNIPRRNNPAAKFPPPPLRKGWLPVLRSNRIPPLRLRLQRFWNQGPPQPRSHPVLQACALWPPSPSSAGQRSNAAWNLFGGLVGRICGCFTGIHGLKDCG